MMNYQKFNFLLFLTINSVTTGVRELNGTSQISLVTHDAKSDINLPYSLSCYLIASFIHSTILDSLPAFQVINKKEIFIINKLFCFKINMS